MSTSALKWTALVLMVLDHLGEFFPGQIPLWFRYLGRMSAPLFLFCLAVGMRKTRSRTRYIKRLWIGSAVMGSGNLLLTLLYPNAPVTVSNNILSTMVVIAVLIWIFESFDDNYQRTDRLKRPEAALGIFAAVQVLVIVMSNLTLGQGKQWARFINGLIPNIVFCEGSIDVVLLGLILYFCMNSSKRLCIGYIIYCALQLYSSFSRSLSYGQLNYMVQYFYQWMMIGSLPLMLLYNGRKGKGNGKFFYFFYPAHIWIFFLLSNLMGKTR